MYGSNLLIPCYELLTVAYAENFYWGFQQFDVILMFSNQRLLIY